VKTCPSALPQLLIAAFSLGAIVHATDAHAADIGHARLLSAAGQPLRLVVPVTALTAQEAATLAVRAADPAAWQQHRLTPPVALDALRVTIEPGLRADARNLVISAAQPPQGAVVDMLLDLASASGQRRVQVSVLVAPSTAQPAADITLPRTGAAAVSVQHGNVLWRIASQHQYADATIYQMLAAFYQTNRPAFLRNNMNWLRAGATLTVPDAATVRAIDPLAARRLFLAHQDAFFYARTARAGTVITVAVTGQAAATPMAAPPMAPPEYTPTSDATGDRVRLSGATPFALPDQSADEQVARQRAQRDAALRVAQLERNISDLNQALLASANVADAVGENGDALPAARLNANGANADAAAMATQAAPPASAQPLVADATTERRSSATATVVGAANAAAVITDTTTDAARIPGIDAAQRDTQRAAPPASALDNASPQGMATRPASAQGTDAFTTADSATDNTPASAHTGSADTAVSMSGAVAAAAATADTAHTDTAPTAQSPGGVAVGATASATTAPATTTDTTQANQTNEQAGITALSPASSPAIHPPDTQTPPHWSNNIWVWAAALGAAFLLVLAGLMRRNKAPAPPPADPDDLPDDAPSPDHEAMLREQFAKQLKTIDLNLDDAGAGAGVDAGGTNPPPR